MGLFCFVQRSMLRSTKQIARHSHILQNVRMSLVSDYVLI